VTHRSTLPFLVLIIAAFLLLSGCTSVLTPERPSEPVVPDEPIVGAWVLHADPEETVLYLYIFKDYGRFDAAAFSGDPSVQLAYEQYIIAGSWESAGDNRYSITGQMIHHDFATDSHQTIQVAETLVYDPATDVLSHQENPQWRYIRLSYDPQIPPGLNVSIPFD